MSLFIVCFDLKNADSIEYNIWETAFNQLYTNNNKKIERTTWLINSNGGADSIYTEVIDYVKSELVARNVQELKELEYDLFEMIDDYQTFNTSELEEMWEMDGDVLKAIENGVRKSLRNVKIFVGKISDSEDNLAGCLSRNDWDSQIASLGFKKHFKNRYGKCKIKLL